MLDCTRHACGRCSTACSARRAAARQCWSMGWRWRSGWRRSVRQRTRTCRARRCRAPLPPPGPPRLQPCAWEAATLCVEAETLCVEAETLGVEAETLGVEAVTSCVQAVTSCVQMVFVRRGSASRAAEPERGDTAHRRCNPMTRGCNHVYQRLQPCASEAATMCIGGCNRVHRRLQPHA